MARDGEVRGTIEFDVQLPLNEEIIRGHIAHANTLRLPELFAVEPLTLNIVASGPSAKDAPLEGPTLAVNAALGQFLKSGTAPTYWAACDPQELVADFLPDEPPMEVTYLVASKCHPKVFEKLKGRDVRLWHVSDYVPGGISSACSITLTAMTLFIQMGVRKFNVWGWDGCYSERGSHHIGDQPDPTPATGQVTVSCGDLEFVTTPAWANEAQDALYLLQLYKYFGVEVVIHGRSMLEAIRNYQAQGTPPCPAG